MKGILKKLAKMLMFGIFMFIGVTLINKGMNQASLIGVINAIFGVGFIILPAQIIAYNKGFNFGYEEGKKQQRIETKKLVMLNDSINSGTDWFEIVCENEIAHKFVIEFGHRKEYCSDDGKYKYYIASIENLGVESKIIFERIKEDGQTED